MQDQDASPRFPPLLRAAVSPEQEGNRLDAVLRELFPGHGLRAWRRLCRLRRILVNGHPSRPGRKARAGDEICLEMPAGSGLAGKDAPALAFRGNGCAAQGDVPDLVAWGNGYAALRKPAGLHTVRVSGGSPENLEEFLALHWADLWRARQPHTPVPPPPRLVTRLDRETSGLVLALADASPAAEEIFRAQEREGRVEKGYLALIHGDLRAPLLIRAGLVTRGRRTTKVLSSPDPDATRHTWVTPLRLLDGAVLRRKGILGQEGADSLLMRPVTLIQARILRGSRHQIRAHLAGAGFPLVGDSLYGEKGGGAERLFLHHAAVSLPGFFALEMPDWGVGEEAARFPGAEA
jgi:23S rRNA pseudouridine1911/1915/1917 synthase